MEEPRAVTGIGQGRKMKAFVHSQGETRGFFFLNPLLRASQRFESMSFQSKYNVRQSSDSDSHSDGTTV